MVQVSCQTGGSGPDRRGSARIGGGVRHAGLTYRCQDPARPRRGGPCARYESNGPGGAARGLVNSGLEDLRPRGSPASRISGLEDLRPRGTRNRWNRVRFQKSEGLGRPSEGRIRLGWGVGKGQIRAFGQKETAQAVKPGRLDRRGIRLGGGRPLVRDQLSQYCGRRLMRRDIARSGHIARGVHLPN